VRVFTRDGVDKDSLLFDREGEVERVRKDFADQQRILEDDLYQRVRGMLIGRPRRRSSQAEGVDQDHRGISRRGTA